jgi:hypothetical protein
MDDVTVPLPAQFRCREEGCMPPDAAKTLRTFAEVDAFWAEHEGRHGLEGRGFKMEIRALQALEEQS